MFEPTFQKTHRDRINQQQGQVIHNESNALPGHEDRMKAHCEEADKMMEILKKNTRLIKKVEKLVLDIFRYLAKISIDFDDKELAIEQEKDKRLCIKELKGWFITLTNLKTKNEYH